MKLTKKLEKEVMAVYENYWDSYLNGDVAAISTLLDESYTQVGSAETEVFANKTDAVQFLHDTIDQVAGKLEMRNRSTRLEKQNNFLLFHELCDIYALAEPEWIFYSKFRATTLMEEKKDGWKIIHQHSSFPDVRTDEGENIAIDKIAEENQLLREAIKRRTIELEYKNRELEIEASLERVRAQAMGMTKPDDLLSICEILFKEFQTLGFTEIRNSMINIHNDAQGTFLNYDFSEEIGKSINHLTYNIHPVIEKQIKQIRAANDAFSETIFTSEDLESWKEFRRNVGEKDDPRINNISALYYYFYSIGTGSIGISTFSSIDQEKLELLKRFRNVFNLSYQRYIDIALAEAQTREAQIELGLERVRARAMAMQNSNELSQLVDTVFKELTKLDFALSWCIINIIDESSLSNMVWAANPNIDKAPDSYHMKFEDYPFHDAMMKGYKERATKYIYVIEGLEKKVYDEYLFKETEFRKVPEEAQAASRAMEKYVCSFTFSNFGGLQTVGDKPLSDSNLDVLERFGKVFDLTYTRFNDLQKAEAQAREAQIEAALERVRSRTMGMQKSEELKEVIQVVYEQFVNLNIHVEHTGFILDYKARDDMYIWLADKHEVPSQITIPYFDSPHWNSFIEAKEKGIDFFANHLTFEEKNKFYQDLFKFIPDIPEETLEYYFSCPGLAGSTVLLENVGLYIENFSGIPYSEEENNTLMRFGKVFQQTYTRFLDLQKAEAQAREAQIEAALERVRSRSMAMYKSEELADLSFELVKQVQALGIATWFCAFNIYDEDQKGSLEWGSNAEGTYPNYRTPREGIFLRYYEAGQRGETLLINEIGENECAAHYDYLCSLPGVGEQLLKMRDSGIPFPTSQIDHVAYFKYGYIIFITYEPAPEAHDIFKRFAKVFEQTYTRFLDLQKAEAQAREAQIEAALEKVRSRSLAMHKSDEMQQVANAVYEQLNELGIEMDAVGMSGVIESKKDYDVWISGSSFDKPLRIPFNDATQVQRDYNEIIEKRPELFTRTYSGENKKENVNHLLSHGEFPDDLKKRMLESDAFSTSLAFSKNSSIQIARYTGQPYSDYENEILKRFAKVFEQAYIRFLDLQKSEAQARESQIEVALERVRSRSMAMHKSEELSETAELLFGQINLLGKIPDRMSIGIINEENKNVEFWVTDQGGNQLSREFFFSLDEPTSIVKIYNAWKERKDSIIVDLTGQNLEDWLIFVKENAKLPIDETKIKGRRIQQAAFFSQGFLLLTSNEPVASEIMHLLVRFAKVFEQTYTRFLDLLKAEAQARDAQIEASLERVRSRAMAIRKSQELDEVIQIVFQELGRLGIDLMECSIATYDTNPKDLIYWSAGPIGSAQPSSVKLQYIDHPLLVDLFNDFESGVQYRSGEFSGEFLKTWWDRIFTETDFKYAPAEFIESWKKIKNIFYSQVAMKHGFLEFLGETPLPEDKVQVLKRFAKVVDLTYTRYDDVVKAEAQARESQIEAALERVRGKAMAMHSSDDLAVTVDTFFAELNGLNVMPHRCGVGIINPETRIVDLNATTATQDNQIKKITGKLKLSGHPVLDSIFEHWKLQKEYHPVLRGKEILEYYKVMNPQVQFPDFANDETQYGYYFFFKEGGVFGWTEKELAESDLKIFRRFNSALSLTYRRYLDLKESEARALEAIKKSSLDRVRAEIASMRSTEDLNRITPIIWRELKTLEVPFFRCGVFIVDEDKAKVQVYLTTPDGKSLGVLNLPFDSNELTSNTVEFWRRKEVYKEHWNKEEFISWSKSMLELGQIKSQQEYQGAEKPPESLDLHFIPFDQGMLYVGNKEPLASEKIDLVKSLAEAFSIAYARYEDFDRLETAKKEVESAFGELDIISKELKIKNEELENENQRKALELEEARQLQLSMLPKVLPKLPNLDIAVYMKTATEVGGDYYDFHIQSDGALNILIGDATGHGMKSGMMVSIMKSFFIANRNKIALKQFFDNSNDSIKNMQLGRLMMALMGIQITSTKVIATNAGMPSLIYFRNKSQKAGEFVINNLPLGAMKGTKYSLKEINYEKGDTLLLMSDGFGELKNERDEQYGYPRIIKEFKSVAKKSSNEIVDYLQNSASEWAHGVEPDDDVTFVVIQIK